jgi:hypothetical protein
MEGVITASWNDAALRLLFGHHQNQDLSQSMVVLNGKPGSSPRKEKREGILFFSWYPAQECC